MQLEMGKHSACGSGEHTMVCKDSSTRFLLYNTAILLNQGTFEVAPPIDKNISWAFFQFVLLQSLEELLQ